MKDLTPKEIVKELDKYIIGQDDAKKSVAIALRNRWRRQHADQQIKEEIMPNNIILIGPTGTGKTEISRRLANLANAPFLKIEATKFTEVGYVGRDVESMIRDLLEVGIKQVRDEQSEIIKGKAEERAIERILDELLPSIGSVSDQADEESVAIREKHQRTRSKMKEQLEAGLLDQRQVEIDVPVKSKAMQVIAPLGMDELGINIQEMLGGLGPKRKEKKKLSVQEALEYLIQEEINTLLDMDKIVSEAIQRVENNGIIFLDEIDKVAVNGKRGGNDVSREGVQRDLLPVIEGTAVNTKHGSVKTDHILFIASGAFHVSKPSDLIPELQGRFPIRVELKSLTESDFVRILTEPKNALLKQYSSLIESEGFFLKFDKAAIKEIARLAAQVNEKNENIGARRLHTILSKLMEFYLYEIPDLEEKSIKITKEIVNQNIAALVSDEDLSHYIL
ncbi:MAG: ATP-dependent protease ATPase subunit HslU [Calditrichaeota bacterium]|nr:ATP-dependent protease ATPase subunit HslU [Calditrichota bacterium]